MNVLKVKKGETLARKQDKVMEWYLIQEGSVIRQFAFAEIIMHRNAIVGILENEWFACDYVANEDTTLIVIPCKNAQDLRKILSENCGQFPVHRAVIYRFSDVHSFSFPRRCASYISSFCE